MAKKKTILDFYKMKQAGEQVTFCSLYDAPFASYAEQAGIDLILVGDSVGMLVYGLDGTTAVTMDQMIMHAQAVRRGAPNTFVIGDLPFGAYHESPAQAVHNSVRFIKEAGMDAVKVEGGEVVADAIRAIRNAGIVVAGHVGLTPQSSAAMGGFRAQGRTTDSARAVIEDAIAVYKAGAFFMVIEGVPEEVSSFIAKLLPIPIYGCGAGGNLDGQTLVLGDLMGMDEKYLPKFAKRYCNIAEVATAGFKQFIDEIHDRSFPSPELKYKIVAEEKPAFDQLFEEVKANFKA